MILDDAHKIEAIEFYKCFQVNVHDIAYASSSNLKAWQFLRRLGQGFLCWDSIFEAGISVLEELFLRSALDYLMNYRLKEDFKEKMRLALPADSARCAFGIVDETGTLKPNQVFFQATQMDDDKNILPSKTTVIKGTVTVFRNPVMQAGDVRQLDAVDVPGLR